MVEVLVAVSLVGIMFVSLYSGISSGFAVVQLARENLRATQILQEKMETIHCTQVKITHISFTEFIFNRFAVVSLLGILPPGCTRSYSYSTTSWLAP